MVCLTCTYPVPENNPFNFCTNEILLEYLTHFFPVSLSITSKSARALQREKQIITLSAPSLLPLIFFVLIVGHDVHYTTNVSPKLRVNKESSTYTDQRTVAFEIPAT